MNAAVRKATAPFRAVANGASKIASTAGITKVTEALSGVKTAMGGVANAAETSFKRAAFFIGVAGAAAYTFKRQFIDTASLFENLQISLEGIFGGSLNKARDAMAFIKRMTVETPFEMLEIGRAFRTMLGFGLDPMSGALQAITDQVAKLGGSGDDLTGIAMQLGQAFSKGRLQAQDANILVERGVPVWGLLQRAIARVNGGQKISIAQLRQMSEDGKIGIKGINLLWEQMGLEAQGAGARMMKTWTGMVSNLSDQWTFFTLRVMETGAFDRIKARLQGVLDTINEMAADGRLQAWAERVASWLERALDWLEKKLPDIIEEVKAFVGGLLEKAQAVADVFGGWGNLIKGGLAAYIGGPLVVSVISLVAAVVSLGVAISLTPIGWLLLALGVLAVVGITITKNWGKVKAFFVDLWDGARLALDGLLSFIRGDFAGGFARVFVGLGKIASAAFAPIAWVAGTAVPAVGFGIGDFVTGRAGRPDVDGEIPTAPGAPAMRWPRPAAALSPESSQSPRLASFLEAARAPGRLVASVTGPAGRAVSPALDLNVAARSAPLDVDGARPFTSSRMAAAVAAAKDVKNRVVVEFKNAPKGLRVTADPSNPSPIDFKVGYAMADGF